MPRSMSGRFRPFRERSSPPTLTMQITSGGAVPMTSSWMYPSFRKSVSPGFTARGRRLKETETRLPSPVISSVVRVNGSPVFNSTGSSAIFPMRIFGPERSARIARRRSVRRAAARRFSMTVLCCEKSPWEKLMRAMSIPASSMRSIISGDCDAGPMVQTILVLCVGSCIFCPFKREF